jgi:nicotinamidase-related amidase
VKPQEGEHIVTKTEINSFLHTDLDEKIKEAGVHFLPILTGSDHHADLCLQVDNLVVCGAMTHMCVDSGVRCSSHCRSNA